MFHFAFPNRLMHGKLVLVSKAADEDDLQTSFSRSDFPNFTNARSGLGKWKMKMKSADEPFAVPVYLSSAD